MEFIELVKARHSIRKYLDRQISREHLEKILEAGLFAPNAGGAQRNMMVAVHSADLAAQIGRMNLAGFDRTRLVGAFVSKEQPSNIDDPQIQNGFYDAPSVVVIFGQNGFLYREADAFCCAENMLLAATALGLASCIVSRGAQTFDCPEGIRLLSEWNVPQNYSAICFVALGNLRGEPPQTKPRRPGRVMIAEDGGY